MDYENSYFELGNYAHDLIRSKARGLIGKAGYTSVDCDDIEQELAMDLLQRLAHYDPAKAKRTTFMVRVVEHRIATLIEERNAACRDWRACRESLDDPEWRDGDEGGSRVEAWPDSHAKTKADMAFEMDLEAAMNGMPAELRELWELLLDSKIYRVSNQTGIPRTTLYDRLDRLREALRKAGL